MPHTSRSVRDLGLVLAGVVLGAGCTGGSTASLPPPVGNNDSGVKEREIPEAGANDGGGGGGTDGGSGTDGGPGVDASGRATVTVDIVAPKVDAIVPLRLRWIPEVVVTVKTLSGPDDDLSDVTADVLDKTKKVVTTKKLALTERTAGATKTFIYRYSETPIDAATLLSGNYELRVTATTVGGNKGVATVAFRGDAGPIITILKPVEKAFYKGAVTAQVRIRDDLFGPVKNVTMRIGMYDIDPTGPTPDGQWTASIDFNKYMPALDGPQIFTVTAANQNDTLSTASAGFTVDNVGPTITGTKPAIAELIGQVVKIECDVADPAGVLSDSVVAVVAHGDMKFEKKLKPASMMGMHYAADFDTRVLSVHALYPSISFRASDTLGNESSVGYLVTLDNTPPLADLDAPRFRVYRPNKDPASSVPECSHAFDTLGNDAVSDGQRVAQLFDIRALILDYGNTPLSGGSDVVPISTVDPKAVDLLVLDETSQPLVVDSDGDGLCDDVNPNLIPTSMPMSSMDALLVKMIPIPIMGLADFTSDTSIDPVADACVSGAAMAPPMPLCTASDMTVAVGYASMGMEPAVWTLAPIKPPEECVGRQFDALGSSIADGWVCAAVRASDKVGNMQVSRVIRFCVDKDSKGGECDRLQVRTITDDLGQPIRIETGTAAGPVPHGLSTGEDVLLVGIKVGSQALDQLSGRWTITKVDDNWFSLDGTSGGGSFPRMATAGDVVPMKAVPDCTGTQTSPGPPAVIDSTPCRPWCDFGTREYCKVPEP